MNFVGVMTGTSIDGLDLAVLSPSKDLKPRFSTTVPLPSALRESLEELAASDRVSLSALGQADVALGEFTAQAVLDFLRECEINPRDVRAIGSHGQTIQHAPERSHPFSMQIGSGAVIAEITRVDTVVDFRVRDVAAGGQGAPLVPVYHKALFGDEVTDGVVLNIGGIANLSILAQSSDREVTGFDTGPGNALMDAWIRKAKGEKFDKEGAWASDGQLSEPLLDQLLADPFYRLNPPKSTGKEHFNLTYLERHLQSFNTLAPVDVQRTLCELTVKSIHAALDYFAPATETIVVCGGGRRNGFLMTRLVALEPKRVICSVEDFGVDGDTVEAAAFAYLAWLFINHQPGNVPAVTGAQGPRILGCLYPA